MADAADLKSAGDSSPCRFESGPRQGEPCVSVIPKRQCFTDSYPETA